MRAILCTELGAPETLTVADLPRPALPAGHARVRVHAAGVNYADCLMIAGQYQEKPPLPFVPGMEGAGEVIETGEGVDVPLGRRVAFIVPHGAFAAEAIVPATNLLPIPDGVPYGAAAAVTIAYGTAHIALAHRGRLQPGETVLVHGAGGGVGLAAVAVARRLGATVIATASTPEKLALAEAAGAAHLINYRETAFRPAVKALTQGRGVDVVFDPVGGDVFDQSIRCLAWEGRLLIIGFAGGRIPQAPANLLLVKNASAVGVYWGRYLQEDPALIRHSAEQIFAWVADGAIAPHVSAELPLSDTPRALRQLLDRQARGRFVIRPQE